MVLEATELRYPIFCCTAQEFYLSRATGLLTRHRITVMPNCQRCAMGHRLKLRLNGPHYPGAPT